MITIQDMLDADLITKDKALVLAAACARAAAKREKSYDRDLRGYRLSIEQAADDEPHSLVVGRLLRHAWNETLDMCRELDVPLDWPAAQKAEALSKSKVRRD